MKTKLTITVDRDLIPRAKKMARERGVSLSSIIEGALREMAGEPDTPSFSERWHGAFTLREEADDRAQGLREKYG